MHQWTNRSDFSVVVVLFVGHGQIFFCSRTHSQLSQFVDEVKKTAFHKQGLRLVTLAGRGSLCVNDSVRALGSDTRMSDRCLELAGLSDKKRCEYGKQDPQIQLRDTLLVRGDR